MNTDRPLYLVGVSDFLTMPLLASSISVICVQHPQLVLFSSALEAVGTLTSLIVDRSSRVSQAQQTLARYTPLRARDMLILPARNCPARFPQFCACSAPGLRGNVTRAALEKSSR